jgi:hypothetical protein
LTIEKPLRAAMRQERMHLRKVRELADVTVDTSEYSVHQIKALVMKRFRSHPRAGALRARARINWHFGASAGGAASISFRGRGDCQVFKDQEIYDAGSPSR